MLHKFRRWWLLIALAVLLVPVSFAASSAPSDPASKYAAGLQARLAAGERVPTLIVLNKQATLTTDALASKTAKGRAVVAALRAQAERTQKPLLDLLAQRGIAAQSFVSVNAVAAELDAATAQLSAARPDVAQLVDNSTRLVVPPVPPTTAAPQPDRTDAIEASITKINAPQVWAQGFTGQGIVVAGEDTGIQWDHPALKNRYRGWNGTAADHAYNWHDSIHNDIDGDAANPCGFNVVMPCDDDSHGTHTVGTMVGTDGGTNQIGVAPSAKWIGCRNMEEGNGRPSTYIECIDWMLAPYAPGGSTATGNPDLAPDVINNSWGCPIGPPPTGEDCTGAVPNALQTAVQNVSNAGIMFVVSAGNSGSGCATISDPPALFPESFVVGSTTINDTISSFSSRGPITYGGVKRIGPDISAPGSSIRSAVPNNVYGTKSGTSMAGPHIAGVVALLWSARPELRGQIQLTRQVIQQTAFHPMTNTQTCDGVLPNQFPNNTFGYGRVDALAAIQPTLRGQVTVNGSAPVTATLTIASPTMVLTATATGAYTTTLPNGQYTVTARVANAAPQSATVQITTGTLTTQNFAFGPTATTTATGTTTGTAAATGTVANTATTTTTGTVANTTTATTTGTAGGTATGTTTGTTTATSIAGTTTTATGTAGTATTALPGTSTIIPTTTSAPGTFRAYLPLITRPE